MYRPSNRVLRWSAALAGMALLWGAVQWRPLYVSWKLTSAKALLDLGDSSRVREALAVLRSLEGMERPERAELLFQLGRALRRNGELKPAFAMFRQAQATGWPAREIEEQVQLGMFQGGRFDQPGPTLEQLIARNNSDPFAYELYEALSKGYLHAYRFLDAQRTLNFWIDWRPQDAEPRLWRAGIWEKMDKWEQAVAEYQGILKYNPRHYEARLSIARVQMSHLNSVDAAREGFERCLAQRPDDVGAILGLAECERRLSEPDAAEARLRALEQRELSDDQKSGVWMQLGQILMERRQLPEAIDLLNRVVAAEPHNSTAMYTLGLAFASDGKQAEAEKMFQASKKLDEQFTRLTDITIILASQPNQPDLRWEAGQILMDQGLHREGADWMATALMFDPDHLKTHRSLAQYYAEIVHDPQLAAKHQGKVRKLSPTDEPPSTPGTGNPQPADSPDSKPGKSASS